MPIRTATLTSYNPIEGVCGNCNQPAINAFECICTDCSNDLGLSTFPFYTYPSELMYTFKHYDALRRVYLHGGYHEAQTNQSCR